MLKVALCNEVLRDLPFAAQCTEAAALGYDALEIAPFTLGDAPHRLSDAALANIRRALTDAGIAVSGLHMLMQRPEGLSITSLDPAVAARTREVGESLIVLCAELGGRYLVHGSAKQRELMPGQESEGRAAAIAYFEAMAHAAERAGVVYCVEPLAPHLTSHITSVAEGAQIADTISSLALRTMLDCAHASYETRKIPDLIAGYVASGHIAHIHANDPNRRGPGQGALDFKPIIAAIKASGFEGTVGIEPFVYEPDGLSCARDSLRYLRDCGLS
ncbi:MAG: sugar phosphate isomerase/epimerase family protein [Pseudolabrys sp.]